MQKALVRALMVAAGLALAFPAAAADYTFKFAHSQPEDSVRHKSMLMFKDALEKASGGRIAVEVFSSSQLGSEPEVMDMVKMGTVQGTRGGAFTKANKKFLIYTLPFLYADTDAVLKAMRSDFGTAIAKAAEENGYYIPATGVAGGFRQITNNKHPINTPEDVAGLKIRMPGIETIVKTMQALGANPVSIPYGEVYMALKMGVADGQENPPSNIVVMKFYEAAEIPVAGELPDPSRSVHGQPRLVSGAAGRPQGRVRQGGQGRHGLERRALARLRGRLSRLPERQDRGQRGHAGKPRRSSSTQSSRSGTHTSTTAPSRRRKSTQAVAAGM